jgi:hypothetical protein
MSATNEPIEIDLAAVGIQGTTIFVGYQNGANARERAGLDLLDHGAGQVVIRIPPDSLTMTSSFFMGMFERSIGVLGPEGFARRYRFEPRHFDDVIAQGIADVERGLVGAL